MENSRLPAKNKIVTSSQKEIMRLAFPALILIVIYAATPGCTGNAGNEKTQQLNSNETIQTELSRIDSLLRDSAFAETMSAALDAAYYKGIGQAAPPFLQHDEDSLTVEKSAKEEKIAINIAGFYALECGLNFLCSQDSSSPLQWINSIIAGKLNNSAEDAILNRFANATWKAGQPFRSLDRIRRPNFISWSSLSKEEIEKDRRQVLVAAEILQQLLKGNKEEQFQQLKDLLQNKDFALTVAAAADSSYYAGENKPAPPFISHDEASARIRKRFKDEKIATNLAGFYALECGLDHLVSTKKLTPSAVLRSIVDNSISNKDKELFCRFANATWKAGQPFRSLDRITRGTFVPFNFLTLPQIEKDWVQVKAAAEQLLPMLK